MKLIRNFKTTSRNDKISACFFVLEIILLLIMSSFFIPTVDDLIFKFQFEYHSIREFINYVIYYGNGRVLGNAMLLFFSNHTGLFYALQALLTVVLAVIVEKITGLKYSRHYVIAFMLLEPLPVLSKTYSWMSSFINYYVPIVIFSLAVLIILRVAQNKLKSDFCSCFLLFILGLASQLFVESNAVVNAVVALGFLIYFIRKRKKAKAPAALFASTVLGLGIILLFTKFIDYTKTYTYYTYKDLDSAYRSTIFSGGFKDAVNLVFENLQYPFFLITISFFFVATVFMALIFAVKKQGVCNSRLKIAITVSVLLYLPAFAISLYTAFYYPYDLTVASEAFIVGIIVSAFLFAVSCIIMFTLIYKYIIKRIEHGKLAVLLFVLGLISFSPFLAVSPCGFRCCELMMFCFMLSYLIILADLSKMYNFDMFKFGIICAALTVAVMTAYTFIFAREKKVYDYKERYYATSVYLPHSSVNVVHHSDNADIWDNAAGFEHKFIPLEDFEKMLSEGKITK